MNEHHLNEVIVEILGLSNVRTAQDFLNMALEHKTVWLLHGLRENVPFELVPKGDLYVLMPNGSSRYHVDSKIEEVPKRKGEFGGSGTYEQAVEHIVEAVKKGIKTSEETSFNSIFFDEPVKEALRRKMDGGGVYNDGLVHVNPVKLPVRNAGLLTIHQFYVQPRQQGRRSQTQQLSLPYL